MKKQFLRSASSEEEEEEKQELEEMDLIVNRGRWIAHTCANGPVTERKKDRGCSGRSEGI